MKCNYVTDFVKLATQKAWLKHTGQTNFVLKICNPINLMNPTIQVKYKVTLLYSNKKLIDLSSEFTQRVRYK